MKKHLLFTCSLLGILLLALSMTVRAQTMTDTTWPYSGVNVFAYPAYTLTGGGPHNIDLINISGVTDPGGSAAAIATNVATGLFTLNSITISGQVNTGGTNSLLGFINVNNTAFLGTINGQSVTVNADNGEAIGVFFRDSTGGRLDIGNGVLAASVTFGDIIVTTGGLDDAYGFSARGLLANSSVTLGNVKAHAVNGKDAAGVEFRNHVSGDLKIASLDVKARERAQGIAITNAGGTADLGRDNHYANIGKVDVTATNGVARGIFVADGKTFLNLNDTLTVKASGTGTMAALDTGPGTAAGLAYQGMAYGIWIGNNDGGKINLNGNIDVTGSTGAYGIRSTGDIVGNSSINVHAYDGWAIGVNYAGAGARQNVKGTVTLGDITAISDTKSDEFLGGAYGFAAIGVEPAGKVTLGKVTAHATAGDKTDAAGVVFYDSVQGTLVIEELDVIAGDRAHGLTVTKTGGTADLGTTTNRASIGTVNVKTTGAGRSTGAGVNDGAYGVFVDQGDAYLNLKGNITATATAAGGKAYGIGNGAVGGDIDIRLEENVAIYGTTAGIMTKKDLKIDLNNKNLTTNSVDVQKDLFVYGNGYAKLDVVNVGNNFKIGNNGDITTVAVDGVKIRDKGWLGNVQFGKEGKLEIFGNTKEWFPIGALANPSQEGQIINKSSLTKWGYNPNTGLIESFGARDRAYANDNYLAATQIHQKYTAWNAVRDHVISGATQSQPRYGYYGQAPSLYQSAFSPMISRSAWINYVGRGSHYRSSFNNRDWDLNTNGVQIGSDLFRCAKSQFGMLFGYENSTGSNSRDHIKANDYYVGAYGVHVFNGGMDFRTVFNYGWQDYNSQRSEANDIYYSSFHGNTVELNVELGKRCYFGQWSARPSIAIDWYLNKLNGGRETSVANNTLWYDKTDLSQLFFRFGSDLRYERGPWAIESGLYYSYDMRGADLWSGVSDTQTREIRSALIGSKLGRSVLALNLSGSWQICRNFTIFGGYRGEVTPERAGNGYVNMGHVGGAWRW